MVSPVDELDPESETGALELAREIAEELAPKSTAFFQVFRSDGDGRNHGAMNSTEPIYGEHYMPRKFKIGFAHPTDNAVDVLTQDVGFVPVDREGRLWDLYSGGGLGLTHNNAKTAPYLGLYHGRIRREQVVDAAKAIAILQKEHGERKDRKQARWKYTIRRLGLEAVNAKLRERFGLELEAAEPVPMPPFRWYLGWHEGREGRGYYGLSIENGRIQPDVRKAVRAAVEELGASVMLTPLHDLLLCDVGDRAALERIEAVAREIRWLSITSFAPSKLGLLANRRLGEVLREWIGEPDFAEAEIPFAVIAADIASGERVVIDRGDVLTAVMASACIPGIFQPVERAGRLLVDGGIVENLPTSPLRPMGARTVIGIDLNTGREYQAPDDLLDVVLNATDIAINNATRLQVGSGIDLPIAPRLSSYGRFDTGRGAQLIREGHAATQAALAGWRGKQRAPARGRPRREE